MSKEPPTLSLRQSPVFHVERIYEYALKYGDTTPDNEAIEAGENARRAGFLTKEQFLKIAKWKSRRPSQHYERNSEYMIRDTTRLALSTLCEELRLRSLTLLHGVSERTASVILHHCHLDPYPIMDARAIWSLGIDDEPDWTSIWPEYVRACRAVAKENNLTMRLLDRALWGFAKMHDAQAK